ncbi:Heme-binding protein A [Burkholderiales bacterium]|nr:Heme-binding protein A [Burkholderiales bacterium]
MPGRARALRALAAFAIAASAATTAVHAQPASWADSAKTLRVMIPIAETGFDPQATSDLYSSHVNRAIFDTLFSYDYLARPYRMVPNTAAAMPEISADGRTWTIRLKRGIRFADDPAFGGRPRELTAHDYVYAWKRLLDPRMRSPYLWYLNGKVAGADGVLAKAKADGRLDYDAEIPGLRAVDRYTIRLVLNEPDYVLQGYMSHVAMAAVAREVIESHGDASGWAMTHPVGTGPFRLKEWRRGQRIVLEANPGYREELFPAAPANADAGVQAIAVAMKGKRLPQVGRVEISVIEESGPQLLAFNSGALDYANVPADLVGNVLDPGSRLKAYYAGRKVALHRAVRPSLSYTYFNMEDPVVGGYTPERVALRRAITMAFNVPDLVRVWWQEQAQIATQPIPPNVAGHGAKVDVRAPYDPATARALLDRFGYRDRDGDGWRDLPDGKPFTLMMGSTPTNRDRERDELWKRSMTDVGIRIDFVKQKFPELLRMGRAGLLQMWPVGWITSYGEGDAFMQLLYSGNIGQSNYSRFRNDEYDDLYRRSKLLRDGPERDRLYARMAGIVAAYAPWDLGVYSYENTLVRPWVRGYLKHVYWEHPWKFHDIDVAAQRAGN